MPAFVGFPNPRVVVNELRKGDCTASKPATNWNSTLFDGIMSDFMVAVCGPNAVKGDCKLSVVQQVKRERERWSEGRRDGGKEEGGGVERKTEREKTKGGASERARRRHTHTERERKHQTFNAALLCSPPSPRARPPNTQHTSAQLSTMPSWMYVGGYCQDGADSCLPVNPWDTTDPFSAYAAGGALVDKTCGEMARYMGRLVGWYTAGGFHDECGHWHESNLQYTWYVSTWGGPRADAVDRWVYAA